MKGPCANLGKTGGPGTDTLIALAGNKVDLEASRVVEKEVRQWCAAGCAAGSGWEPRGWCQGQSFFWSLWSNF